MAVVPPPINLPPVPIAADEQRHGDAPASVPPTLQSILLNSASWAGYARSEDKAFYESLERMAFENLLHPAAPKKAASEEAPRFNGHTLPQPSFVSLESEITIDFYAERPECRMQRFAVEVAEKILDHGSPSDRFGVLHGIPKGVPQDCFEGEESRAHIFVLVDKQAIAHGHTGCLAQVRVSPDGESFQVVPYVHPQGYGERVAEAMISEALASQ